MERYTQKQLRSLVENGVAIDISHYDNDGRNSIEQKETSYTQIGYASGIYGCSGMLIKGRKTGQLYAITSRTQAIFIF